MKPKIKINRLPRKRKKKTSDKLFLFTKEDELRILYAKVQAAEYMKSYGKGQQPRLLNRSRYF